MTKQGGWMNWDEYQNYTKAKGETKRKRVHRGTIIKLFRKYYKHGEPGSAVLKDHEVVYETGLLLTVYAIDVGWVEHLDKTFRSQVLRCRTEDGKHMNVIPKLDTFQIIE